MNGTEAVILIRQYEMEKGLPWMPIVRLPLMPSRFAAVQWHSGRALQDTGREACPAMAQR